MVIAAIGMFVLWSIHPLVCGPWLRGLRAYFRGPPSPPSELSLTRKHAYLLPSPSFWQSESSMQPVRTPPEVSALLLLPEAADVTATETAAITARHASKLGDDDDDGSMTRSSTAFEIGLG